MDTIDKLLDLFAGVAGIVAGVEEGFEDFYEASVFVGSIASMKIYTSIEDDPERARNLTDGFNWKWYSACKEVTDTMPEMQTYAERLREKYPVYSKLFLKVIDPGNDDEKRRNAAVQLAWELFTNCTGKERPDNFLLLYAASAAIAEKSAEIFNTV